MTAKENAWEIINKFKLDDTFGEVDFYQAVHYATKTVELLIQEDELKSDWWLEVKKELDEL